MPECKPFAKSNLKLIVSKEKDWVLNVKLHQEDGSEEAMVSKNEDVWSNSCNIC